MHGQTHPPIGRVTKTPTQTLTRVRNNQRRHRQRRREHIASLEQRLKNAEERLAQVQIENAALRSKVTPTSHPGQKTLDTTSLTMPETKTTQTTSTATRVSREIRHYPPDSRGADPGSVSLASIAMLQPDFPSQEVESEAYEGTMIGDISPFLFSPNLPVSVSTEFAPSTTYLMSPLEVQPRPARCSSTSPESSLFNKDTSCLSNQTSVYRASMFLSTSSTTLCSQAYFIIQQHNRRQLPMDAVERWLWPGFIDNSPSTEHWCRVDNQLLLGLLEYIT